MANDTAVPLNRIERILRTMTIAAAALSVLAMFAAVIAGFAGVDVTQGVWPAIVILPVVGLPTTFLLILAFLIAIVVRRRRLAQNGG